MIATWMLYAMVIGALVGLAALVGERAMRALRLPVRMVWVAACCVTLLAPVAAYVAATHLASTLPAPSINDVNVPASRPGGLAGVSAPAPTTLSLIASGVRFAWRTTTANFDRPLGALWAVGSLLLFGRLALSVLRLRRRRRAWAARDMDGTSVLISPDVGPAVVGLRSMHIVMPEWSLVLEEPLRAMVLRHEAEHRRVGDPYVLFGAVVACVLVPWNLALWWQARRLRLAVEMDCDARVLRDDPRVDRYGALLLAIAQRSCARMPAAIAALTESPSDLERRIDVMTKPSRPSRLTAIACGGAAAVTLVLAGTAPVPEAFANRPARLAPRDTSRDSVYTESQVDHPVTVKDGNTPPVYPAGLRGAAVAGRVLVRFVVDTTGRAQMGTLFVIEETDSLFFLAVRNHLPSMKFSSATLGGRKVRQLVEMPFVFTPDGSSGRGATNAQARAGAATRPVGGAPTRGAAPGSPGNEQTYFEFQVERQVTLADGNTPPTYPAALRAGNIEGNVLVSFVVDTSGRAVAGTLTIIKTTHDLFTAAVRDHLPDMNFIPAQIGAHKVKQLVQMPFVFTLNGVNTFAPVTVGSGGRGRGQTPGALDSAAKAGVYFEFQVERQVMAADGNTPPAYPPTLRAAKVEGNVLVTFVVDTSGHADMTTFKVVKTTHDLFTNAVRDHLPDMTFLPAQLGGHKVKQIVQMPFVFTLRQ